MRAIYSQREQCRVRTVLQITGNILAQTCRECNEERNYNLRRQSEREYVFQLFGVEVNGQRPVAVGRELFAFIVIPHGIAADQLVNDTLTVVGAEYETKARFEGIGRHDSCRGIHN